MKICSLTDIGVKREMNQDYFYSSEEPVGRLPSLFIVADGMGGHKAGEFASRYTVETIVDTALKSRSKKPREILEESIAAANRKLIEYADAHPDMRGMGTTVVAAVLTGPELLVANVGDSRLYIVGEQMQQLTRDHSLVQEMIRLGEIDAESAKHHPDKNIITRAVGVSEKVKPDFFTARLLPGQRVLLCTDGLSNMVEESAILKVLNRPGGLEQKLEKLVELANQNGGKDNITVIIIEPDTGEEETC